VIDLKEEASLGKFWNKYFDEPVQDAPFIMIPITDPIMLGRHAEDALKNPAVIIALDKMEAELVHAWKSSAPKEEEARERLYYRLEGIAYFKAKLTGLVNNMIVELNKAKRNAA